MHATTRTSTPTIIGLLSIIALLLALLATGTAAVAEDTEPSDDSAECAVAATTDADDCADDEDEGEDGDSEFGDLPDGLPHIDGISWLADEGLTNGCAAGKFCPNKPLKRGEFASFLYRYHKSEAPSVDDLLERIELLEQQVAEYHATAPASAE